MKITWSPQGLILLTVIILTSFVTVLSIVVAVEAILGDTFKSRIEYVGGRLLSSSEVCVGDQLAYFTTIYFDLPVDAAHQTVTVVSIWSVDSYETAVFDPIPQYATWIGPTTVTYADTFTVPELPSGEYELRHSTDMQLHGTDAAIFPFTVLSECN